MRNLAEKQRRTKLNAAINDLSQLVPMISNSSKKIEKTSVLRLSAVYLRLTQGKNPCLIYVFTFKQYFFIFF